MQIHLLEKIFPLGQIISSRLVPGFTSNPYSPQPVGHLDYTLASIQLPCSRLGLVDSLVLYGTFSACTLAVYGTPYEDEVNNFLNKPPPSPSDSKRELLQVDIVISTKKFQHCQ